jgi:hypothetical protein
MFLNSVDDSYFHSIQAYPAEYLNYLTEQRRPLCIARYYTIHYMIKVSEHLIFSVQDGARRPGVRDKTSTIKE